jgi:NAD(P) transhydrogenase subunit beta
MVNLAYLLASVLFILSLRGLSSPRTAVRANLLGGAGMLIAVLVTLVDRHIVGYEVILAGLLAGSAAGAFLALKVKMTAMPQMVALLNGLGGAASALVAGAALVEMLLTTEVPALQFTIAAAASGLVGGVTLSGSLVALVKLQELISDKPVAFTAQRLVNALTALICLGLSVWVVLQPDVQLAYWTLVGAASLLGILLVIPIGGADMPVVISLLNSYSGLAACATGFVLENTVLIVAGSLVGASGIILTSIMCRAMNRSLANVLFGAVGAEDTRAPQSDVYGGKVKSTTPGEAAILLEAARHVVIVPGYGLAVSQAQHALQTLATILERRGIEVLYGIHPVAGRMPGHMNVLLAEADVPYDKMKELDDINGYFDQTDVAVVIGANDVVNPVARAETGSPIAGMPILDVDRARTVLVIKRSLSPGFAGIPNPLFASDNTLMLFADARQALQDIISSLKEAIAA